MGSLNKLMWQFLLVVNSDYSTKLFCFVFEKFTFLCTRFGNIQTDSIIVKVIRLQ